MVYTIKRGVTAIAVVKPTGQQSKKIMGENIASMTFDLATMVKFEIGDTCDIYEETYVINAKPNVKKVSSVEYNYTIEFQGSSYELAKMTYLSYDSENALTISDFSLMGNADTFIDLLIANANRVQSGWVKGVVDDTTFLNLSFSNEQCLSVLGTLATTWNIEWWVDGKTVHMTKRGTVQPVTFKYGKGNGLYDIERTTQTDKNVITRLRAYGSEQNIPASYKNYSPRLTLPNLTGYIEANVLKYGIIEDATTFDDVYPHRTGLVTSVGSDEFTFSDSEIDFDVNAQALPGIAVKAVFQTGLLSGYTFDVKSYNNTTKTFIINQNNEEKGFDIPSPTLKPAIGDQYVLVNLNMPQTYIDAAEAELMAKAVEFMASYSNPIVIYSVNADPKNFKDRMITITLGNYIRVVDTDFELDADIRVLGYTKDLQQPYLYTMDLTEVVNIDKIIRQAVENETVVKSVVKIGKSSNQAYNAALQAKATSAGFKAITDYWGITLDAEAGLIASGTLLVGSGSLNNAGITGVTDAGTGSVRFWAGADYDHRYTAPFQVLEDGTVNMTQANVTGVINALSGQIGNFSLFQGNLTMNELHGTEYNSVLLGDNVLPGTSPNLTGTAVIRNLITNNVAGTGVNYALILEAANADKNIALDITGGIVADGEPGYTFKQDIGGGFGMRFVNGIYVATEPM